MRERENAVSRGEEWRREGDGIIRHWCPDSRNCIPERPAIVVVSINERRFSINLGRTSLSPADTVTLSTPSQILRSFLLSADEIRVRPSMFIADRKNLPRGRKSPKTEDSEDTGGRCLLSNQKVVFRETDEIRPAKRTFRTRRRIGAQWRSWK